MIAEQEDVEEFYGYAREVWRVWRHRAGWSARLDAEDSIQAAAGHCWAVREKYRPELSSRRSFFTLCARRHITELARQTCVKRRRGRTLSLDVRTEDGKRPEIEVVDPRPTPALAAEHADQLRAVVDAMQALPSRRWYVVWQRFMQGRRLEQIGQELGITRERVRQLEESALEMMTRTLARS